MNGVQVLVEGAGRRPALRWAATEARRRGVGLQVLIAEDLQARRQEPASAFARALLAIGRAAFGLPLSALPADKTSTAQLLRRRSADADLLVVPADLPELGTVVAESYCPVAVVPDRPADPDGPVVVGVAPWTAEGTVELAFAAAAARRATLVAVRAFGADQAVDLGLLRPDRIAGWDRAQQRARAELEMAVSAERFVHPEVAAQLVVAQDGPADLLLTLSTRAQLLVLGRSERGVLLTGLAGSPVDALLRAARCPTIVVPAAGPPRTSLLPSRSRGWALARL
jgi:hypothetical protein